MGQEEDEGGAVNFDEVALGLQLQQFLDEWHQRVLHSGMAYKTDRITALGSAVDLYGMHGVSGIESSKPHLVRLDEPEMVAHMSSMMPDDLRTTFGHYALQLQLVVAATCRVRHALEEGDLDEVARIMDEGDAGVTQQILRRAVVESSAEVLELNELAASWHENMQERVRRLLQCQEAAEQARKEAEEFNRRLDRFKPEQNQKASSVVLRMASLTDRYIFESVWQAWVQQYRQFARDRDLHMKYRKLIEDSQKKLLQFKAGNKSGVLKILMRKAADSDRFLGEEVLRTWSAFVSECKETRALDAETQAAKDRLAQCKDSQVANSKKVMMRMAAGSDGSLLNLTWQAWQKFVVDSKAESAYEASVKQTEQALAAHIARKGASARAMLARMFGTGDKETLLWVRGLWIEVWKQERQEWEVDEAVKRANATYASLNGRRKTVVKAFAERTNQSEEELVLIKILLEWSMQAKLDRMVKYYSGKMDGKKQQLEAVQNMFKSFATQLETGISTTPRSVRKARGSGSQPRTHAMPPA